MNKRYKLNKYQRLLWTYANLYPNYFYNLGLSFKFTDTLRPALLQEAFEYLVNSVEILHSVLVEIDTNIYFETRNDISIEFGIENIPSEEMCENSLDQFTKYPFDLYTQCPIRARLYKLPDHSYILAIIFHHICIDGISVTDLMNLLAQVYNERIKGNPFPKLQLSTFKEYDQLLQKNKSETESDACLKYWNEIFNGKQLNVVFPGISKTQTNYEFNEVRFELGIEQMKEIAHLSRRLGTTPFLVILSAWMYVLHRFSNQADILVDSAINLRPSRLKNLIGFFVNNLPISASFTKGLTCEELILQVTKQRKKLKSIQSFSLEEIFPRLQKSNIENVLGSINIGINFVGWSDSIRIPLQDTDCHFHRRMDKYSHLDLLLEVDPSPNGLARICYCPDFSQPYIQTLIESLNETLKQFTSHLLSDLSDISLLSQEQIDTLLADNNRNLSQLSPVNQPIHTLFDQIARQYEDHPALVYNNTSITYGALSALCEQNAYAIRHIFFERYQQDMPMGEPIGIYTADKRKAIIWILSILKAGGTYVNFEINYPSDRIRFITEDYDIRYILSDQMSLIGSILGDTLTTSLENTLNVPFEVKDLPIVSLDTNAYIISTSGTTGLPKGVPITHRQTLQLIQSSIMANSQHDIVLQYASLCFDASVWEIFSALLNGGTLVIANEEERYSPKTLSKLLHSQSVTSALIPPVMLSELPRSEFPLLTKLIVGGDSTPKPLIEYWQKGRTFINAYGPTECTVCATACIMDDKTPSNDIGRPIKGIACYVLDDNKRLLPPFVRGELYIGGPQVSKGYIRRNELNQEKFTHNPYQTEEDKYLGRNAVLYKTGDLVSRLPNGHILFHERVDFQVKIHGFRIELGEIENTLNQYPGIKKSIVIARDYSNEKKLIAYIQTDQTLKPSDIRDYLSKSLPHYMIPAHWVFRSNFELTTSGKIDRKKLPEPENHIEFLENLTMPQTKEEQLLLDIISSTCQLEHIGVETDLFDQGVSSIQVMIILSEAYQKGLDLSVANFNQGRCIRKILQENQSPICFWGNTYDEKKPIMVLVCGDPHFHIEYQEFATIFGQDYSILVLDSIHEYARQGKEIHWNQLINDYTSLINKVLMGKEIKIIAGYCIGGEIGLGIANQLIIQGANTRPELLLLDSFSKRDKRLRFEYPGITQSYVEIFNKNIHALLSTQEIKSYPGKVMLFLAKQFTTLRLQQTDANAYKQAQQQFLENAKHWKEIEPQCSIFYINTDHWQMLNAPYLSQIKELYNANSTPMP